MTEHTGLPPTPIDNPGDAAIQGILHPTPGDWLYFSPSPAASPSSPGPR